MCVVASNTQVPNSNDDMFPMLLVDLENELYDRSSTVYAVCVDLYDYSNGLAGIEQLR